MHTENSAHSGVTPFILFVALMFAGTSLGGCATATVTPVTAFEPAKQSKPTLIVVSDFSVSPSEVKQSHGVISKTERKLSKSSDEENETEIGQATAKELSSRLVHDLQQKGLRAEPQAKDPPNQDDFLLIAGHFTSIDQGAALQRVMIGFGAGKSSLDTNVIVYRVSSGVQRELLAFTTHADSGKIPGTALMLGAGAAATGGVGLIGAAAAGAAVGGKVLLSRVNYLADKTADQVNRYLMDYFAYQHWTGEARLTQNSIAG